MTKGASDNDTPITNVGLRLSTKTHLSPGPSYRLLHTSWLNKPPLTTQATDCDQTNTPPASTCSPNVRKFHRRRLLGDASLQPFCSNRQQASLVTEPSRAEHIQKDQSLLTWSAPCSLHPRPTLTKCRRLHPSRASPTPAPTRHRHQGPSASPRMERMLSQSCSTHRHLHPSTLPPAPIHHGQRTTLFILHRRWVMAHHTSATKTSSVSMIWMGRFHTSARLPYHRGKPMNTSSIQHASP